MNPILITGGAGNLACQLTYLLPADQPVILADVASAPVAPVRQGTRYVVLDMADAGAVERVLDQVRPESILHFASLLSGSTEADRAHGWEINANATFRLFESCLKHGVGRLLFPSSIAVHGGQVPDPLPEDHSEWPDGLYGVTKVAVERLGTYYHRKHGFDFRCVRLPIIISPFAPAGAASAYASRVFVECAQSRHFTFHVPEETRVSTLYVADALAAFLRLLDADPRRLTRRVYNLHGISPSAGELAAAAHARFPGSAIRFEPDPATAALIAAWPAVIDDGRARADWDWCPQWDLDRLADDMRTRCQPTP